MTTVTSHANDTGGTAKTDPWHDRVESGDWDRVTAEVNEYGGALLPQLLTAGEARHIRSLYADDVYFRATVNMERHRFGEGQYRYFKTPSPGDIVRTSRPASVGPPAPGPVACPSPPAWPALSPSRQRGQAIIRPVVTAIGTPEPHGWRLPAPSARSGQRCQAGEDRNTGSAVAYPGAPAWRRDDVAVRRHSVTDRAGTGHRAPSSLRSACLASGPSR